MVTEANPNTIVVVWTPGVSILTPWYDEVKGVVIVFVPGQEYGNALAVKPQPFLLMAMWDTCILLFCFSIYTIYLSCELMGK